MTELDEIRDDVKEIKKLLLGNGEIGIAEKARRAFDYCQAHRASKNGLLDWAFRVSIMLVLGFIATKVGVK